MTPKQQQILDSALHLFAEHGYSATPTSLIAKEAGVSEGLIFRHFGNKDGLLKAVLDAGVGKALEYFQAIDPKSNPIDILRAYIELPFRVLDESEQRFWRLIYTLKWQQGYTMEGMQAIFEVLTQAFSDLGYNRPEAEAHTLMAILDGVVTTILLKELSEDQQEIKTCLFEKYQIKNENN